jgi:ketosteroid isomerase-like protein
LPDGTVDPVTDAEEMNGLADRMARAYEQGDLDGIAACYAPDAVLWHNFDGSEQTVAERRTRCTLVRDGGAFAMPTCMNVTVRDGLVTHLDEYLDSVHLRPLQTD